MIKKIVIIYILINTIWIPKTYATDEIILSQMDALNINSFTQEGDKYTKEVFPDIDTKQLLDSAISGSIDNKKIYKGLLRIFGDEVVSSVSILESILIIVIIHSLLKSFTENLNSNKGIGQIAYYVQYILIVTIVMANYTNILNMIKDSIQNLVGFANSLVPVLLALMSASRKCCICYFSTTINNIFYCIYFKYNNFFNSTYSSNCNNTWNNI